MPELPEVETVRRGLLPVMEGRLITNASVNRPDLRWPFPVGMAGRLTGKRVTTLRRRSKYILADLDSGETLIIHLGMSGRLLISGALLGNFHHDHPIPAKHDHVVLDMESGARVTFNDARRFGSMDLIETDRADTHPLLANIGPEPFGNTFSGPYLVDRLKSRNTPIKSALLDQSIIAGLGNIYVCEVLFRARISPTQRLARSHAPASQVWCPSSAMFWPRQSRLADHPCAITGKQTANLAISSTPSRFMAGKAPHVSPPAVHPPLSALYNRAAHRSIAPNARNNYIRAAGLPCQTMYSQSIKRMACNAPTLFATEDHK